jgi:intracellular sulfur oxidation DsrE/DsrF family protein
MDKSLTIYKDLPQWAKGVVVVGGMAIIYFTGRSLWKKLNETSRLKELQKEAEAAKNDLNVLAQQGIKPTLSQTELEGMSQELVSAFDGCGTDEKTIQQIFRKVKNEADVYALISTYGARSYDDCNLTEGFGNTTASLSKSITNELSASDISTYINSTLEQRGIKYRF